MLLVGLTAVYIDAYVLRFAKNQHVVKRLVADGFR